MNLQNIDISRSLCFRAPLLSKDDEWCWKKHPGKHDRIYHISNAAMRYARQCHKDVLIKSIHHRVLPPLPLGLREFLEVARISRNSRGKYLVFGNPSFLPSCILVLPLSLREIHIETRMGREFSKANPRWQHFHDDDRSFPIANHSHINTPSLGTLPHATR